MSAHLFFTFLLSYSVTAFYFWSKRHLYYDVFLLLHFRSPCDFSSFLQGREIKDISYMHGNSRRNSLLDWKCHGSESAFRPDCSFVQQAWGKPCFCSASST